MSKIKIFSLGGLNETAKICMLSKWDKKIYVFDAGLKYDNERNLGIDYIIPNFDYLVKNKKRIQGIFLTHGHESNMGAIPDMAKRFKRGFCLWDEINLRDFANGYDGRRNEMYSFS